MLMVFVVLSSHWQEMYTILGTILKVNYSIYCTIQIYSGCYNKLNTQPVPVAPVYTPSSDGNTCHIFSHIYVTISMLPWHV
jgi:hypothetical protein